MIEQAALRHDTPRIRDNVVLAIGIAAFVGLVVFLYALSWNSRAAGFLSDDAVYLLMADGFSPYRAVNSALFHYVMRQSLFPPFYPMLLAFFGGGSAALLVSHWITTTTLVLSLVVFGLWAYRETGNRILSLWLLLVLGLLPETLLHNLEILSEYPYLLLSLAALWLAARDESTWRRNAAVAVCVGLAAITRSAGLSLVVAFGIWLFRNRVRGRLKWFTLALAPSLAWFLYKTCVVGSRGGYGSLWEGLWTQIQHNGPMFVLHFLVGQAEAFWSGLLANLDFRPSQLTDIVLALMLLTALPVWLLRLRAWRLDALYMLIGGAMILVYPFPMFFTRLVLPWVPIVLLYSRLGVKGLANRVSAARVRSLPVYGYLAVLTLMLLPSLGFIVQRFAEPVDTGLAAWKHTRYWFRFEGMKPILADVAFRDNLIDAFQDIPQWVPNDQCVYGVYTAIGMLYSRRIFQQPPVPANGSETFERVPRACRYFFVMAATGEIGSRKVDAFYPLKRIPPNRVQLVHVWMDPGSRGAPSAMLLRVIPPT